MEIDIKIINSAEKEYIKIGCHKMDERVRNISRYVKMQQGSIEGIKEEQQYELPVMDIYYVEAVDDHTFIYMKKSCYESRKKLYEIERILGDHHFARISKSVIVNLMKVQSIKPALNGRFLCRMNNNEDVIISRKYVPEIKKILRGETT